MSIFVALGILQPRGFCIGTMICLKPHFSPAQSKGARARVCAYTRMAPDTLTRIRPCTAPEGMRASSGNVLVLVVRAHARSYHQPSGRACSRHGEYYSYTPLTTSRADRRCSRAHDDAPHPHLHLICSPSRILVPSPSSNRRQ